MRASRRAWGLVLGAGPALWGLLVLPPTALAGCGDYVRYGEHTADARMRPPTPEQGRQPDRPTDHPAPCSGPLCSRQPVAPPASPSVPPAPHADRWCIAA